MILYKKDSKGKIRSWEISTTGPELIEKYGLIDGKKAESRKFCKSKNKGRSNETTPEEQAVSEMQSKINKKLDEGYFVDLEEAKDNKVILPMLAKSWDKEKRKVKFPCLAQPKLDGMRALWVDGKLISRKGKVIENMNHIVEALQGIDEILDGELYVHGENFQTNMKYIKKYREGKSERIKFCVYDMVNENMFYEERKDSLNHILSHLSSPYLEEVITLTCPSLEHLKTIHTNNIGFGYEGTMIRWGNEGYKIDGRSSHLLKYKDFIDVTAKIIDVIPQNARPTHGMFVCENEMGVFKATPKMSHEEREELLTNKEDWIDQTAEIRYFEESEDGLPRFPICVGVRLDK